MVLALVKLWAANRAIWDTGAQRDR